MGNAWFVDSIVITHTPNEECDALNTINIKNTAVLDAIFSDFVKDFISGKDSAAIVELISYHPDRIEYKSHSNTNGIIVFSEIYYPYGWTAYIDDKPVEHFRANYTLRGLPVPAGDHSIRFEFRPTNYDKYEKISFAFVFILYSAIIGGIVYYFVRNRKKNGVSSS
jgi:uncharacterized membrane protein YfhO